MLTQLEEWAQKNPFEARMSGADVVIRQHAAMKAQLEKLTPEVPALTPELVGKLDEADAKVKAAFST